MNKALKWTLISTGYIIGAYVVGVILLGVILVNAFVNPGPPADIIGYESSLPLNGAQVQTKWYGERDMGAFLSYKKMYYKQTYDSGVVLGELSADGDEARCDYSEETNFRVNDDAYDYSCKMYPIKGGGRYLVESSYFEGKFEYLRVEAVIDKTSLGVGVPSEIEEEYVHYSGWQEYFDAMEPVDLSTPESPSIFERVVKYLVYQE